jgi:pyridoxamine 5'-phosphate oxidase
MPTPAELAALRQDYAQRGLRRRDLHPDPLTQFATWLHEATTHGLLEPNAMTLATVDPDGQPWTRTVLLKACDPRGLAFFTHYTGAKGRHLAACPRAALTFWWPPLERQVNLTGTIEKTTPAESAAYFASRPRPSQLGAWASPQSTSLPDRATLEAAYAAAAARFGDGPIPCPATWGGYRLLPATVEFWQGRRSRLHDRFRYTRTPTGWHLERLAP